MINLLPSEQKDKLYQYRIKKMMLVLGFIGTVFLVSLSILLLTINIRLRGEVDYQGAVLEAKKGKSKTSQIEKIQDQFSTYNKKLTKLEKFYKERNYPSGFFEEVNSTLPSSIRLNSLAYQKVTEGDYKAQASFSGYCPDRSVLLQLKENMDEKSKWENVDFPPSNWVEPADINFNVSFKIEDEDKE